MKIIREINGKTVEIELTAEEINEIYDEKDREYLIMDIESELDSSELQMDEENITKVANVFKKAIGNNDGYWEHYWDTIQYSINEVRNGGDK